MESLGLFKTFSDDLLSHAMDGHHSRQNAIVSNIANVETPNYNRRDVSFQGSLQNALNKHRDYEKSIQSNGFNGQSLDLMGANAMHFESSGRYKGESVDWQPFETTEDSNYKDRNDGNAIDVETEMVALARNAGKFKSLTVLQGRRNQMLKTLLSQAGQV